MLTTTERRLWKTAAATFAIAGVTVLWNWLSTPSPDTGYNVGDSFAATDATGVAIKSSLVLWINTDCLACQLNMPFYAHLTATSDRMPVVIMTPQAKDDISTYLSFGGVTPSQLISTNGEWLRFKGTPTILLVDAGSRVSRVWYGKLDDRGQADILTTLAATTTRNSGG